MTIDAQAFALDFLDDAGAFLEATREHLAEQPVVSTVVTTVAQRAADGNAQVVAGQPFWFVVVRDADGVVVGAAMRTAPFAPHPMYVLPMPEEAARQLARALYARGEHPGGANGALPAAQALAEEYAALSAGEVAVSMHTRLFELGELVEPPMPAGRPRLATYDDDELCLAWFHDFGRAADEQSGRAARAGHSEHHDLEEIRSRIDSGQIVLWELDGTPVHLTGFNAPTLGVARVGPVYTPVEHRSRGYASAAVAHVSRMLLDRGARVCLFTDQANPTSNKIYEALGFRAVVDTANFDIS